MLSVFGDESADETQQRVFAVAGVIGSEGAWAELEAKWAARNGGIPFHAADCESGHGAYRGMPEEERQNLYRDLAILLAESGLGGWGFAIDLSAQRRVFPEAPDISYYKCFLEVVQAMRNCAAYNRETVSFTFDMRRVSEYNTSLLYDMVAKIPSFKEHLFSQIAFECSRDNHRLQAGDLLARETMKALDNKIGPIKRVPRKSWLALYNTGRFHIDAISEEWFEGLKRQMPVLEKKAGMSQKDYLTWLKENGLQDNTTNLFIYMEWTSSRFEPLSQVYYCPN